MVQTGTKPYRKVTRRASGARMVQYGTEWYQTRQGRDQESFGAQNGTNPDVEVTRGASGLRIIQNGIPGGMPGGVPRGALGGVQEAYRGRPGRRVGCGPRKRPRKRPRRRPLRRPRRRRDVLGGVPRGVLGRVPGDVALTLLWNPKCLFFIGKMYVWTQKGVSVLRFQRRIGPSERSRITPAMIWKTRTRGTAARRVLRCRIHRFPNENGVARSRQGPPGSYDNKRAHFGR